MAKTIEELKEMIDSVIVENGRGQITGQGLNLVLNEMSDALSEMGGGGGACLVYVPMGEGENLTKEQIAFNAKQYDIISSKMLNGELVQIGTILTQMDAASIMFFPTVLFADLMGLGINQMILSFEASINMSGIVYILLHDGSVMVTGN